MWAVFPAPIFMAMQRKILDRWIVNRWIVHRELAQPFFHRTPPTAATSVSTENIPANV